jgi:hypothetical protein
MQSVLAGTAPLDLTLTYQRSFFDHFHAARIHLYESDSPDVDSTRHHHDDAPGPQRAFTMPGGLYIGAKSDSGYLHGDTASVDHEKSQTEAPRILLALTPMQGDSVGRYSPLLPLPSTLMAGELHPWNTAMHIAKIPFSLCADPNQIIYLQPRYSQWQRRRARGS